jgi:pyrroloquinoline quinone (PQQ) biosynthesis protein C
MARNDNSATAPITERIIAVRDLWHTKRHPFFAVFADGKLPLRALGRYQALHYHFVSYALRSFGLFYARAYHLEDVRKMMAENLAEEEGLRAIPQPGHEPHDHNELMLRFCRAAGLSDDEVRNMKMPPAWWARSLYHYNAVVTEPIGVVLAMQTTQEGQMPGLIGEVLLPAFEKHYGFKRSAPEIEFFTEHDAADVEHSRRQSDLCAKYLDTPELEARALTVAQQLCELRWASISDLYRSEVLGEKELLPTGVERPGVAASA